MIDFWFKTLRDNKVRVAKDHGKKFRSRLAYSIHYLCEKKLKELSGTRLLV